MGAWGTGLFADDTACDVRDEFRELVAAGWAVPETTVRLRQRHEGLEDSAWVVALAVTQWKTGRLLDAVRDEAIQVIDQGADLALWDEPQRTKRAAVLAEARSTLLTPQPKPTRIKPVVLNASPFEVGDLVAYTSGAGLQVAFWVIGHHVEQRHAGISTTAELQLLAWGSPELPSLPSLTGGIPARNKSFRVSFTQLWLLDGMNATSDRWTVLANQEWDGERFNAIGHDASGRTLLVAKEPRGKHKRQIWIENWIELWMTRESNLLDDVVMLAETEALLQTIETPAPAASPTPWGSDQRGEFVIFLKALRETLRTQQPLAEAQKNEWVGLTARWGATRGDERDNYGGYISNHPHEPTWERVKAFDRDFYDFVRWEIASHR